MFIVRFEPDNCWSINKRARQKQNISNIKCEVVREKIDIDSNYKIALAVKDEKIDRESFRITVNKAFPLAL